MRGARTYGARTCAPMSERDRRFALLAAMLTDRRGKSRGWASAAREGEDPMDQREDVHISPTEAPEHVQPVVTEDNKERVRAGVTGHHVRTVLIASLALVIVAFCVIAILAAV